MDAIIDIDTETYLSELKQPLQEARAAIIALRRSGKGYTKAKSLEVMLEGLKSCEGMLARAAQLFHAGEFVDLADNLDLFDGEVRGNLRSATALSELESIAVEAAEAGAKAQGKPKESHTANAERLTKLEEALSALDDSISKRAGVLAGLIASDIKEKTMSDSIKIDELTDAVNAIGLQLSLTQTTQDSGGSAAAGSYRDVGKQLGATLDHLGMPRRGVEFAIDSQSKASAREIADRLMDNFSSFESDGQTQYRLERTTRTPRGSARSLSLLAGAASIEARVVETEARHLMAALEEMPQVLRFQTEPGVPTAQAYLGQIDQQLAELVELMEDPFGVNKIQAELLMRRIGMSILSFLDLSELQPSAGDNDYWQKLFALIGEPEPLDDDELAIKRTVVSNSRHRAALSRLARVYNGLFCRIAAFARDDAGTYAARLEMTLQVIHASAEDLRAALARSGTSMAEQNVALFATRPINIPKMVNVSTGRFRDGGMLSITQLIDWVATLSQPYADADYQVATLGEVEIMILATELQEQLHALKALASQTKSFGFTFKVSAVSAQLNELASQLEAASEWAHALYESAN